MRLDRQLLLLGLLPLLAVFLGLTERDPGRMVDQDGLFSTCIAAACVGLIFLWYWRDAQGRGYRRGWGLGIAMVLITSLALPWYLLRSRRGAQKAAAIAWAVLLFAVTLLAYRFASTVGGGT